MKILITYWLSTHLLLIQYDSPATCDPCNATQFEIHLQDVIDYVRVCLDRGYDVTAEVLV